MHDALIVWLVWAGLDTVEMVAFSLWVKRRLSRWSALTIPLIALLWPFRVIASIGVAADRAKDTMMGRAPDTVSAADAAAISARTTRDIILASAKRARGERDAQ